jgi:hypothetical protein
VPHEEKFASAFRAVTPSGSPNSQHGSLNTDFMKRSLLSEVNLCDLRPYKPSVLCVAARLFSVNGGKLII